MVSASSSDREFESHKIRINLDKTSNPHKDYHVNKIFLLNSGLNFYLYKASLIFGVFYGLDYRYNFDEINHTVTAMLKLEL